MDHLEWPVVPEIDRPRVIYHAGSITNIDPWKEKGWEPKDVRLLPSESDHDRRIAVKAWLEGMRTGAIEIDQARLRAIETEARVLGLMTGKEIDNKRKAGLDAAELDTLLTMTRTKKRE